MRMGWALGVVIASIVLVSDAASAQTKPTASPVAKIAVTSKSVTFDGAPVTLEQLKLKLADLKKRNGAVWYYREASTGQGDPPPQALEVIQLIVDQKLPVSLSTKPDFSDVVDDEGEVSPRK
jgi:hypothetical protein